MTSTVTQTKSAITLKGSSKILCEYLDYGINSILFQRGLYPPEDFKTVEHYGVTLLMSQDKKIREFLEVTLGQLKDWLTKRIVDKIALVITNVKTFEVMERWDFKVEYEGDPNQEGEQTSDKPLKQIKNEIRDVLKQIISSVAFLPLLDCLCGFDIQIYTKDDVTELPNDWADTDAAHIRNAQTVRMRSFSTNIHKMNTCVTYKNDD